MRSKWVVGTLVLAMPAGPALAGCLATSTLAQVEERQQQALTAYADLDAAGFSSALDDATLLLPCVQEVATPLVAARQHRLQGLQYYAAGEEESALGSLRAARVLDPAYVFPDEILPADHALRQAYEALPTTEGRTERPPQPRDGGLVFDGSPSARRPIDRATIVQLVDHGEVGKTLMLEPREPLPAYVARPRDRQRLLVGAAVSGAAAATFYGLAWTTHRPFQDPDRSYAQLESLQSRSIAFTALSGSALGIGVGLGAAALVLAPSGRP